MNKIIEMYLKEKKSILIVASEIGWGYKKTRNYLLKNNVKLRKRNTKGLNNHSEETKEKMRISKLGKNNPMYGKCDEKTYNLLKYYREKIFSDEELKKEIYKKASKTRIKNESSKGDLNPMKREDVVRKWIKSNNLKPNKKEKFLFEFLSENFPNNFDLNTKGDFLIIDGKIPDFVDLKNKKIIELFGDYWHRNDTEQDINRRKKIFKNHGFDTLIIWESELTHPKNLLLLIEKYMNS